MKFAFLFKDKSEYNMELNLEDDLSQEFEGGKLSINTHTNNTQNINNEKNTDTKNEINGNIIDNNCSKWKYNIIAPIYLRK